MTVVSVVHASITWRTNHGEKNSEKVAYKASTLYVRGIKQKQLKSKTNKQKNCRMQYKTTEKKEVGRC